MTTPEQEAVIERVTLEHGGTKVKPLAEALGTETDAVAVCGWESDGSEDGGRRLGPWIIVQADGSEMELTGTDETEQEQRDGFSIRTHAGSEVDFIYCSYDGNMRDRVERGLCSRVDLDRFICVDTRESS